MDILLVVLSFLFLIVGFVGCVLPLLPGLPFFYLAILLLHFTSKVEFSTSFLIFWLVVIILISVLDYYIPILGTKHFGGGRWGVIGSAIGLVIGLFFAPLGIIIGPFVGAVLGELLSGKVHTDALRAGTGALLGFLFGTFTKLVVAGFLSYYAIEAVLTSW